MVSGIDRGGRLTRQTQRTGAATTDAGLRSPAPVKDMKGRVLVLPAAVPRCTQGCTGGTSTCASVHMAQLRLLATVLRGDRGVRPNYKNQTSANQRYCTPQ